MKSSEYVKGMMVRIAPNLHNTAISYSTNNIKDSVRGERLQLIGLDTNNQGGFINIDGIPFLFDLKDLIITESIHQKPLIFMFDPNTLDVRTK